MLGDNSIAILNPESLAYDIIHEFFGTPQEEVTPFGIVASLFEHKLVGLYIRECQIELKFMRNAKDTVTKEAYEVIPQGETLLCLESARQKDIFFAGGGSTFRLKDGNAKIFAITFDESC